MVNRLQITHLQDFNLLMRENSNRKIIGLYFNGYTVTNTKYRFQYYCGYRAMKILNKKKYKDTNTKRVYIYIYISAPETESLHLKSHNMLDILCRVITYNNDKENN